MDIKDIRASDIKLWFKNIDDVGMKSKGNYLSALKGFLDGTLHDEVIDKNPMLHVKFPKYKAPRIHPFITDEVDLKKRTITIKSIRSRFGEGTPKTFGSKRTIPILDFLYPHIVIVMSFVHIGGNRF